MGIYPTVVSGSLLWVVMVFGLGCGQEKQTGTMQQDDVVIARLMLKLPPTYSDACGSCTRGERCFVGVAPKCAKGCVEDEACPSSERCNIPMTVGKYDPEQPLW